MYHKICILSRYVSYVRHQASDRKEIHDYRRETVRRVCVNFDVMYYAKSEDYDLIEEEIGKREGELIREYMPMLNTQITDENNRRRYTHREIEFDIE